MATLAQRLEEQRREMRTRGLATAPSPADDLGRALDEDLSIMRRRDRLVAAGLVERGATFTPSEPPCSPAPMVGCDEADRHHPGAGGATAPRAPIPAGPAESGPPPTVPAGPRDPTQPPEPASVSTPASDGAAPAPGAHLEPSMSTIRLTCPDTRRGHSGLGGLRGAKSMVWGIPARVISGGPDFIVVETLDPDRIRREAKARGWDFRDAAPAPTVDEEPPRVEMTVEVVPPPTVPPCPPASELEARAPDVAARGLLLGEQLAAIEDAIRPIYNAVPDGPTLDERVRWLVGDYTAAQRDIVEVSNLLADHGFRGVPGENLPQRLRRALADLAAARAASVEPRTLRIPLVVEVAITAGGPR